ncbi:MAG: hypothetical protein R3B82_27540 [Sandaracinaceae bacterium]
MGLLEQLERRRPGYDVEMEHVRFLLDSYTGGGGYQGQVRQPTAGWWGRGATQYSQLAAFEEAAGAPSYLDRYPREDWAKYDARRAQAHLWNFVEPLTNLKLGHLAERRPSYLGQPQALAEWRENVDGVGTTWDEMRPSVALAAAIFGWAPVVIDSTPALEGESVAQARLRGATRPRAIPLTPANLVDYEAGRMRFRWAKVRTDHARTGTSGAARSSTGASTGGRLSGSPSSRSASATGNGTPSWSPRTSRTLRQVPIAVFRHKPAPGDLIQRYADARGDRPRPTSALQPAQRARRAHALAGLADAGPRREGHRRGERARDRNEQRHPARRGRAAEPPLPQPGHRLRGQLRGSASRWTIRDGIYRAALAEFKRPTITKGLARSSTRVELALGEFAA